MKNIFAPSRKLAAERARRGGPRIYDARERWLMRAVDLSVRLGSRAFGMRPPRSLRAPEATASAANRILALRLDRIGDLVTTLPALQVLRELAPDTPIELAVGSWNESIARSLPFVDTVRVIDTPWSAWGASTSYADALYALSTSDADWVVDFQGDFRVLLMMAMSAASLRAGYADTGGGYLLTHVGRWNDKKSWYRQNMDLVETLYPDARQRLSEPIRPYNYLSDTDREKIQSRMREAGLSALPHPLVGIHPSAGRRLKQWEAEKFSQLVTRLEAKGLGVLLTGSEGDGALVERIRKQAGGDVATWTEGGDVRLFSALVETLDVFVTGDTGPMHIAQAMDTANVALFGPSDPVRYGPEDAVTTRRVIRHDLYCSPCNMIRRPPPECAKASTPECMEKITVDAVEKAVMEVLGQ